MSDCLGSLSIGFLLGVCFILIFVTLALGVRVDERNGRDQGNKL